MSVEIRLMDLLVASTDPVISRAVITYGYQPQDDEKTPVVLPQITLQRDTSEWEADICGVLPFSWVNFAVIHEAREYQEAREMADAVRLLFGTTSDNPTLQTEADFFEGGLRAWQVTQVYRVSDENP